MPLLSPPAAAHYEAAAGAGLVREITRRLREEYGKHTPRDRNPTDCLLATILSQHTADRNSSLAHMRLRERYASWEEMVRADPDELAGVIRPAGLANIKARHIQAALGTIQARYGTMDLTFLRELPLDEAREVLRALPGVGPKTAACVLLFSCDLPALPVDTHVHRLARRLGLIAERDSAEKAHEILEVMTAQDDVYDFHVNLIRHGRTVCRAQQPQCGTCVLQGLCAAYQRAG